MLTDRRCGLTLGSGGVEGAGGLGGGGGFGGPPCAATVTGNSRATRCLISGFSAVRGPSPTNRKAGYHRGGLRESQL
jgi:hypothetical protein